MEKKKKKKIIFLIHEKTFTFRHEQIRDFSHKGLITHVRVISVCIIHTKYKKKIKDNIL